MGARLVGHDVGRKAGVEQGRQHIRRVGPQANAEGAAVRLGGQAPRDRVVEVVGELIEVAGTQAPLDRGLVDFDAQRDAAVERHRQRLRAAHPAEAGGQRDRPGERAAVVAPGDLGEALVRPLHDPLGADVDPRAGGHLPVHRQPLGLESAELVPRRPLGNEVRVGDQHPRRPLVRAEDADGLARLDEQRLVVVQLAQARDDRVERVPRAGGPTGAAVDDERVGMLGDIRVEVVHQHPQRRLLRPAAAAELRAARGADRAWSRAHYSALLKPITAIDIITTPIAATTPTSIPEGM